MTVQAEHNAPMAGPALYDRLPQPVAILGFGAAIVLLWYLVTASGIVSPLILPTPLQTLNQLVIVGTNLFTGGYVLRAMWITTQEVLWGFAIAVAVGILLGILVASSWAFW